MDVRSHRNHHAPRAKTATSSCYNASLSGPQISEHYFVVYLKTLNASSSVRTFERWSAFRETALELNGTEQASALKTKSKDVEDACNSRKLAISRCRKSVLPKYDFSTATSRVHSIDTGVMIAPRLGEAGSVTVTSTKTQHLYRLPFTILFTKK